MKLKFWGVRGTAPVSGKDKVKYGGHTLCASLVSGPGDIIVIDAGTGIARLGHKLLGEKKGEPVRIHLFLTHFHLDHIIGMPFFSPLYASTATITFYSPSSPQETEKYLDRLMAGKYFPLKFSETKSKKTFQKVDDKRYRVGPVSISLSPLIHPQGSVAYKFERGGGSVVFATDTEAPEKGVDTRLAAFCKDVDYLIYDAMFTPAELRAGKRAWGHSTWLEGTKLARAAGVRNLLLSHYNPVHSDNKIDRIVASARKNFPRTFGAREGLTRIL